MSAKAQDQEKLDGFSDEWDSWEELGEDNGEIVTFTKGQAMIGEYVGLREIELKEEDWKQTGLDEWEKTATLYVFQEPGRSHSKWSVWRTYQLEQAMSKVHPGDTVRICCTGERKAKQGEVKIFSVLRKP